MVYDSFCASPLFKTTQVRFQPTCAQLVGLGGHPVNLLQRNHDLDSLTVSRHDVDEWMRCQDEMMAMD